MNDPSLLDRITAAAFCTALVLPLADNLLSLDPTPPRHPTPAPAFAQLLDTAPDATAWVERAKTLLRERMGFRDWLIRLHGRATVQGLGTSSNPEVALGDEGWLFLEGPAMDAHRRIAPFDRRELGATLGRIERGRRVA